MGAPERDYAPLSTFPLSWRWTESNHARLPSDVLPRIRPLQPESARAAWAAIRAPRDLPEPGEVLDASGDPIAIAEKLAKLLAPRAAEVRLFWNPMTALRTDTAIFCRYWDDFCYPSSDDVVICSDDDIVIARYEHDERFCIAT